MGETTVLLESEVAMLPEGWRLARLNDLGDISGGGTPSTNIQEYWGGDMPWLVPSDVTANADLYINKTSRSITREGLLKSAAKSLPPNSILMTSRATIGEVVINKVPMATNQGFINLVCNSTVLPEWLAYWMKKNKRVFEERAYGVTFKELSKSNFKTISISLPPLAEQRVIASTLRAAQVAAQARRREAELERERKAALMQALFTRGTRGEATKTTEIGEVPESWEVVRLGEKITLQRGFDLPSSQRMLGPFPVVSSSGITGTHSQAKVKGPGVITGRYGTLGEIHYIEDDYWPLNTTLFVSEFRGNDPLFVSYFLATVNMQSFNDKTSVPGVNRNHVHATTVAFPPIAEQRKIAEGLRACDAVIAGLEREAVLHEELFRALLEELMTGRMRVSDLTND